WLELRLVDGTERRTVTQARLDLDWADLVLLWGGSELDHRVSTLYTGAPPALRRKLVHTSKRGIAALLESAVVHLSRHGSAPSSSARARPAPRRVRLQAELLPLPVPPSNPQRPAPP